MSAPSLIAALKRLTASLAILEACLQQIGGISLRSKNSKSHQYGRGKFEAHPRYIEYMRSIVEHPNFKDMPNSVGTDGRINWQVSSGKTTSFYKNYLERRAWWVSNADKLGTPGKGDEADRFTVTARRINPTGYRPCRLCGNSYNVGYFYANQPLINRLTKKFGAIKTAKGEPVTKVVDALEVAIGSARTREFLEGIFPERQELLAIYGISQKAFEEGAYLRTRWLSPGFMGNPPDRLDGFHDYCNLGCRSKSDPGRSRENLKSYGHDRRSFEWWAEGNWAIADALYNKAGAGTCGVLGCGKALEVISPDHVGPLACGFKQLPLFLPTCQLHNSTKNRRFSFEDVKVLLEYERSSAESVASWQVRAHWDKYKNSVTSDNETKAFSNSLRSLQDMYLRVLHDLVNQGQIRLAATFLSPEYALLDVNFIGLDTSNLTYTSIVTSRNASAARQGLAARSLRIAFDALSEYCAKSASARALVRADYSSNSDKILATLSRVCAASGDGDPAWLTVINGSISAELREREIQGLLADGKVPRLSADERSRQLLQNLFDEIGSSAEIDFSRYAFSGAISE